MACVVVAALVAGCGSSNSGTNADPATVVPATAPLYLSVTIEPKGGSKGDAATAARKLTHLSEPYGRLAEALLAGEGAKPQFKRDIEPWAGERAGVFLTSPSAVKLPSAGVSAQNLVETALSSSLSMLGAGAFGTGGAQGAIVLDTKDASRARSFLDTWAKQRQARPTRYRGVDYSVSVKGQAAAIVKRFVIIGSESGVKGVIDVSLGAGALSAASGYGKPPANAVATAQLAPRRLAAAAGTGGGAAAGTNGGEAAGTGGGSAGAGVGLLSSLFAGAESVSLAAIPTASSLSLEGQARYASPSAAKSSLFGPGGGRALAALPGGAWLAAGVGDVGASASQALGLLRGASGLGAGAAFASIGGAGVERLLAQLSSPKAKLDSIFKGWAGPGGLFVSGTGLFNLQAALTVSSSDPTASRAAVARLGALLHRGGAVVESASIPGTDAAVTVKLTGFPAILFIADGQDKLIVGLGQASVEGALRPTSTLSSSPSYEAAAQALGGGLEPSLIVEWPAVLGFLEGVGLTQNPPLSGAVPYLKSLGTLTAGSSTSGAVTRFEAVLGLA